MRRRDLCAALAGLSVATGAAACGSNIPSPTTSSSSTRYLPNIAQIQAAIAQSVLSAKHVSVTVLCPSVVPELSGETFSCIAFRRGRQQRVLTFLVTEQGGSFVTYRQTS
jgi:hypothetical protein